MSLCASPLVALLLAGPMAGCVHSQRNPTVNPADGMRLRYDERGQLDPGSAAELQRIQAAAADATDVIVFSHGWWNNPQTAECRYQAMIAGVRQELAARPPAGRFVPVLVGIYWPSAIFPGSKGDCESTPGGEALEGSTPSSAAIKDIPEWAKAAFPTAAARPEFDGEVQTVARLLERDARRVPLTQPEQVELVGILMRWRETSGLSGEPPEAPGEADVFEGEPRELATRWSGGRASPATEGGRLGGVPTEGLNPVRWLDFANVFTFWTMKARAGVVGSRGVFDLLQGLQRPGLRIHLIGHSFGGKLLTAAITGHGRGHNQVNSLTMFQGAFSHFAFSTVAQIKELQVATDAPGRYATVLETSAVHGPIVATFSRQDRENRRLYPLAVRISRDALEGRPVAKYGSLGANGIQGPPIVAVALVKTALAPTLAGQPRAVVNVDATDVIRGHSDLVSEQVFTLVADVIRASIK